MQEVINTLASDGGRFRMDQLLKNSDVEARDDARLELTWHNQLLLLLQILSHENMMVSRVGEVVDGTLLNKLYGLNGSRAVPLFQSVLRSLPAGAEVPVAHFETSSILLYGVLVTNSSAHVKPEFQDNC